MNCESDSPGDPTQHATDVSQSISPVKTEEGEDRGGPSQSGLVRPEADHSSTGTANTESHLPPAEKNDRVPTKHSNDASGGQPTSIDHPGIVPQPANPAAVSEWSHQQLAPQAVVEEKKDAEEDWQTMPAYAQYDLYDDDGRLIARQANESDEEEAAYGGLGGAGKGYTRVQADEDAKSATSMDENTAYLFKEPVTTVDDDDEEARDPSAQMQATKDLLTDNQRIAYVGVVRLAMAQMSKEVADIERTRGVKRQHDLAVEAIKMWTQKMMVRLYSHMELDPAEQIMIEQLAEHGLQPGDLTPALMQNARVKNPNQKEGNGTDGQPPAYTPEIAEASEKDSSDGQPSSKGPAEPSHADEGDNEPLPQYVEHAESEMPAVRMPSQLPETENIDIDLRWTVLCDLFLILIADAVYDARSRVLLERVGAFLAVSKLDICRFEKRVTEALEMQEAKEKETWNEDEHMENRQKMAKRRRMMMMGLATVGGGLVIGLSAGVLGPVIGAGLAAGFTTIGISGTSGFLAGAGGAALVGTTGVVTGSTIGLRAGHRRTGAVKTFEYRPLHNNKRVNLIITVAGWLNGKVDDVRLPFSTVDPIMGDMYAIWWEPEMLAAMGQTISILATEALTQGLQQLLGSTILIGLMAALQAPILLAKLSYLIDNPWSVSLARADRAGLILADSLIDRNLGARPITLVGFSVGSRVIFAALQELAKKGALGLVQNVYLFGSPMVAKKDEYLKARTVVAGRFVNGYATNDWILGYLFRATSGGIARVAGLAQVEITGIENVDVTEFVPGHMAYRTAMPRVLRRVGWEVGDDDFTEIEDADPDNHEKRQRELINEIEEARKELQGKPEKRGFGWFKRKKLAEKKQWEIYDERSKTAATNDEDEKKDDSEDILFDVEAIRREAVELASQGLEVKQLETTLPPLKVDDASPKSGRSTTSLSGSPRRRPSVLRGTHSDMSLPIHTRVDSNAGKAKSSDYGARDFPSPHEEDISMTFESSFRPRPAFASRSESFASACSPPVSSPGESTSGLGPSKSPSSPPPTPHTTGSSNERMHTNGAVPSSAANPWMDDDDEFQEKEVEMTFA